MLAVSPSLFLIGDVVCVSHVVRRCIARPLQLPDLMPPPGDPFGVSGRIVQLSPFGLPATLHGRLRCAMDARLTDLLRQWERLYPRVSGELDRVACEDALILVRLSTNGTHYVCPIGMALVPMDCVEETAVLSATGSILANRAWQRLLYGPETGGQWCFGASLLQLSSSPGAGSHSEDASRADVQVPRQPDKRPRRGRAVVQCPATSVPLALRSGVARLRDSVVAWSRPDAYAHKLHPVTLPVRASCAAESNEPFSWPDAGAFGDSRCHVSPGLPTVPFPQPQPSQYSQLQLVQQQPAKTASQEPPPPPPPQLLCRPYTSSLHDLLIATPANGAYLPSVLSSQAERYYSTYIPVGDAPGGVSSQFDDTRNDGASRASPPQPALLVQSPQALTPQAPMQPTGQSLREARPRPGARPEPVVACTAGNVPGAVISPGPPMIVDGDNRAVASASVSPTFDSASLAVSPMALSSVATVGAGIDAVASPEPCGISCAPDDTTVVAARYSPTSAHSDDGRAPAQPVTDAMLADSAALLSAAACGSTLSGLRDESYDVASVDVTPEPDAGVPLTVLGESIGADACLDFITMRAAERGMAGTAAANHDLDDFSDVADGGDVASALHRRRFAVYSPAMGFAWRSGGRTTDHTGCGAAGTSPQESLHVVGDAVCMTQSPWPGVPLSCAAPVAEQSVAHGPSSASFCAPLRDVSVTSMFVPASPDDALCMWRIAGNAIASLVATSYRRPDAVLPMSELMLLGRPADCSCVSVGHGDGHRSEAPSAVAASLLAIPRVAVRHGDVHLSLSPYALRFWEKLQLAPVSGQKDLVFCALAPEDPNVLCGTQLFLSELSCIYEALRLGRHEALNGSLRGGILAVPGVGAASGHRAEPYFEACEGIGAFALLVPCGCSSHTASVRVT